MSCESARAGAVLAVAVLCCLVGGAAQDAAGHAGGTGRNLSEQQLESGVGTVERCAMERSKLDEEKAKYETAQELLASKDRSIQELFSRNHFLESAIHEAESAKQRLEEQLQRLTAVNFTDVGQGQEDAMRRTRFDFAERLMGDALSEEHDTVRLMAMTERLLHVVRGAAGAGTAQHDEQAWMAANAGLADGGRTGGAPGSMRAAGASDASARPPWHATRESSIEAEEIFSKPVMKKLREEVREMFHDSFDNYMEHAYPYDELRPLSCSGKNVFGPKGYALTLIDSLDSLAMIGSWPRFEAAVRRVIREVTFDVDVNVSVFETNIRAVGGLLSAHFFALKYLPWYTDELLKMCVDLADRLMPAFDTKTGIPYGTVNLRRGVPPKETVITSAAGGGTNMLEFTMLSRLTKDPKYEKAARRATEGLWNRRSKLGLVGNHINIETGAWTHQDSGLGTNVDSFYEYLVKAHLLFGDTNFLSMFLDSYTGIMKYIRRGVWYLDVNMHSGAVSWMVYSSLASFWPGVQVLVGDLEAAVQTQYSIHSLWRRFGGIPEGFNLETGKLHTGAEGYPLRPESIESIYYLHKATGDPVWLSMGIDALVSIQTINKAQCGYAATAHVGNRRLGDRMDSYFLAETLKYLYLLFDEDHWIRKEEYVFNTEGHPLPVQYAFLNFSDPQYSRRAGAPCGVPGKPDCDQQAEVLRGACRKQEFKRTISAYGFDLMADEDDDDELVRPSSAEDTSAADEDAAAVDAKAETGSTADAATAAESRAAAFSGEGGKESGGSSGEGDVVAGSKQAGDGVAANAANPGAGSKGAGAPAARAEGGQKPKPGTLPNSCLQTAAQPYAEDTSEGAAAALREKLSAQQWLEVWSEDEDDDEADEGDDDASWRDRCKAHYAQGLFMPSPRDGAASAGRSPAFASAAEAQADGLELREGECGFGWYVTEEENANDNNNWMLRGGDACDSMTAQALFQEVQDPQEQEASNAQEQEASDGLQTEAIKAAGVNLIDGEERVLRDGPCGWGWYVIDSRRTDAHYAKQAPASDEKQPFLRKTPIDDLVMWRWKETLVLAQPLAESQHLADSSPRHPPRGRDAERQGVAQRQTPDEHRHRQHLWQSAHEQQRGSAGETSEDPGKVMGYHFGAVRMSRSRMQAFFRAIMGRGVGSARSKSVGLSASQRALEGASGSSQQRADALKNRNMLAGDGNIRLDEGSKLVIDGVEIDVSDMGGKEDPAESREQARVRGVLEAFFPRDFDPQGEHGEHAGAGKLESHGDEATGVEGGGTAAMDLAGASKHTQREEVVRRLLAVRRQAKIAKRGASAYIMRLFRAKHKSASPPPPEQPEPDSAPGDAKILAEIRMELDERRLKCATLFGADSKNADLCQLKLWNHLLRQAGARELPA